MPPRDDELPEGTDHIINGAMETGGDKAGGGGGASSGFIGASGGDGTGGTAAGGGTDMAKTEGTGDAPAPSEGDVRGGGNGVADQLRGQVYNLRDQAGGKVREFADTGKTRATDLLEEFSRVVADTADSIDERLGNNYGEYARKASDSVASLASNLRGKDVDEIYDDVRAAVRKSPGVAIGIAAVVGFTLVRLVKAGLPDDEAGANSSGGRRTNKGSGA